MAHSKRVLHDHTILCNTTARLADGVLDGVVVQDPLRVSHEDLISTIMDENDELIQAHRTQVSAASLEQLKHFRILQLLLRGASIG